MKSNTEQLLTSWSFSSSTWQLQLPAPGMNSHGSLSPQSSSCSLSPHSTHAKHLSQDSESPSQSIAWPGKCDLILDHSEPYLEVWNPIYKEMTENTDDEMVIGSLVDETPDMSIDFVSFNSEECEGNYPYSEQDSTTEFGRFRRSSLVCSAAKMIPCNVEDDNVRPASYTEQSAEHGGHFSYLHTFHDLRKPHTLLRESPQHPQLPVSTTFSQYRPFSLLTDSRKHEVITNSVTDKVTHVTNEKYWTHVTSDKSFTKVTNEKCWTQTPPASNPDRDNQWKELSKSLTSLRLSRYKLDDFDSNLNNSIGYELTKKDDKAVSITEREKSKSLFMLDRIRQEQGRGAGKNPSNQLMQMNRYQRRVQVSMERLTIPSWYKPQETPSSSPTTTYRTSRWRQTESRSLSSSAGWRRHLSQPPSNSPKIERNSRPLSSQRHKSRCPPQAESSKPTQLARKVPYLGWRHQAAKDGSVTDPAEMMARSWVKLGGGDSVSKGEDYKEENNNEKDKMDLVDTLEYLSPAITV